MSGLREYTCRCGDRFYIALRDVVMARVNQGEVHVWDYKCECGTKNVITVSSDGDEKMKFLHIYEKLKTRADHNKEVSLVAGKTTAKLKDLI